MPLPLLPLFIRPLAGLPIIDFAAIATPFRYCCWLPDFSPLTTCRCRHYAFTPDFSSLIDAISPRRSMFHTAAAPCHCCRRFRRPPAFGFTPPIFRCCRCAADIFHYCRFDAR
jgi:hypothetical protein